MIQVELELTAAELRQVSASASFQSEVQEEGGGRKKKKTAPDPVSASFLSPRSIKLHKNTRTAPETVLVLFKVKQKLDFEVEVEPCATDNLFI